MEQSVKDNGEIPLSDKEFSRLKQRVHDVAGISLSDAKRTLVVSRLSKIIRALGHSSFAEYADFLDKAGDPRHDQEFVNALTTNLTRFYREDHHFEHLCDYVGRLIAQPPRVSAAGQPRLRIWSAGCSTGQEAYTIALSLLDRHPVLKRWDFRILATDVDTNVLAKAARGVYPQTELSGLSAERAKAFIRSGDGSIRIPDPIRALVTFKPLNLIEPWPIKGPFDAIFCRNVAIYFDKPTQAKMVGRFADLLAPEAFLYIGHSENLSGVGATFKPAGKTIYRVEKSPRGRSAA